jgi:predicted solute-binding protein
MSHSSDDSIKIALVNYINAKPFGYGLERYVSKDFNITLANPAECASLYDRGEVDIALVPIGALHSL